MTNKNINLEQILSLLSGRRITTTIPKSVKETIESLKKQGRFY